MLTVEREEHSRQGRNAEILALRGDRTGHYGQFPHKHGRIPEPTNERTSLRHPHLQLAGEQTQIREGSDALRHRILRRKTLSLTNLANARPLTTEETFSSGLLTERVVGDASKACFKQAEEGVPAISNLC